MQKITRIHFSYNSNNIDTNSIKIPYLRYFLTDHRSGIYAIYNINTCKVYIGSAVSMIIRRHQHFRDLKRKKHVNNYLQNSFNKYGIENFVFLEIEYCLEKDLVSREQYWMDFYSSSIEERGFNICKKAQKPPLITNNYKFINYKTGEIFEGENLRKFCNEKSYKYSGVLRLARKETLFHKELVLPENINKIEEIKKISDSCYREYRIFSPLGKFIKGNNVKDFCLEMNFNPKYFKAFLAGKKYLRYHGYFLFREGFHEERDMSLEELKAERSYYNNIEHRKVIKKWNFNYNSSQICITNLKSFCKEHGLSYYKMLEISKGKDRNTYHGYSSSKE